MRRLSPLFLLLAAVSGCGARSDFMTRFHDDGRAKPVIAVAPLIDTSSSELPWSLSEELTGMVAARLARTGEIFVTVPQDIAGTENPFGPDLSWMKREFPDQEFAAFLELVEHDQVAAKGDPVPVLSPQEVSTNLNLGVKVRLVDLRGTSPKIVLQELVRESYYIPCSLLPTDYELISWGEEGFDSSPVGIAHGRLISEVAHRLNDYILLAKSR